MKRLRLCFVGPANNVTTRRWVEWFAARGHDTTILTVEPAAASDLGMLKQVVLGQEAGKVSRLVSAARLAVILRRLKPDVVHAHYVRGFAWGLVLARYHPYVVTPWGSDVLDEQGAFREWYSRRLTRAVLGGADLVTVHSAYMEDRVRTLLPSIRSLARIGWGVDLTRFRPGLDATPLRRRLGIGESQRVLFSPRFAKPFYNHDRIIRALPLVCDAVPDTLLVVRDHFADAKYVDELRRLVQDLGLVDRVRFLGSIPYTEMPLWFNLAHAVVMVPRSDGMPSTLLEAMACGAIPVVSRLPQYTEIIRHGVNGFLVGPDEAELAEGVVKALSDDGSREQIARRNRAIITQQADQEQEMSRMEQRYLQLVAA